MSQGRILLVEDDLALCEVLCETLQLAQYEVETANNGEAALLVLENNQDIALIISDVQMQPMDGLALLKAVKSRQPELSVILMTAHGTVEKAVVAMHEGAADYLVKPFEAETLVDMVSRFILSADTQSDDELVTSDLRSVELADVARRVAVTDATVMISGESGVGKEVIARYIHRQSSRHAGPFVAINCAAIPENMLESVLFGYEKGAFTGAYQSRPGKFEQAQGGTLLLDEITEMDLGLQAKLLRVLQEREVERLGGRKVIPLDVRILATTNRNIHTAVSEGIFREDLFYRLNVFPLNLLPLRDRRGDILPLAQRLLKRYAAGQFVPVLSAEAVEKLEGHGWPGNVRELDNVIQRALILKSGDSLQASHIHFESVASFTQASHPLDNHVASIEPARKGLNGDMVTHEKDLILSALIANRSRKDAAERLGISPRTLRYKLAKLRDAGVPIPA